MPEELKNAIAKLIRDKVELTVENKLLESDIQQLRFALRSELQHLRIQNDILRNDKKSLNDEIEHLQAMIDNPEEMAEFIDEYRAELLANDLYELNVERREYH